MNHAELASLMQEFGSFLQKLLILRFNGKTSEADRLFPKNKEFEEQFLAVKVSVCVYQKSSYLTMEGNTFTVKHLIVQDWPAEDKSAIHAHLTLCYRFSYTGHVEVRAEGIEVDLSMFYGEQTDARADHKDGEERTLNPPSDGKLLSNEETRRFLKSMGLEDLGEK
ncbi:MAG: hypothetical protein Q7R91_02110 [bacterium]|nr:hypothetical protein [bacterium]